MSKNKCNENDVSVRGGAHPQNDEYANTIADYGILADKDNVIEAMTCDATVALGDVVRMSGTTVVRAQADNITNANIIGICINKTTGTQCDVQVCGYTPTLYGGLDTSKRYFLSDTTPGALTITPPTASGSVVQMIGRPRNGTSIVINFTVGMVRD